MFDPINKDPAQIKSQLSKHGNSVYHNLWMNKGCPKNIRIMDLGLSCFGPLREKRFGIPGTRGFDGKFYDGIHMRGILTVKYYTDSFIRMLRPKTTDRGQSRSNYHNNCAQTVYQQRNQGQSRYSHGGGNTGQKGGYSIQTNRGFDKNRGQNNPSYNGNVDRYGRNIFTIRVYNRFSKNY